MKLSILHISDLHRDQTSPIGNQVLIDSLERDRDRYTEAGIMPPNLIIVSGDIVQGIAHDAPDPCIRLRQQYDEAFAFLTELAGRFVDGDKARTIIVPGNHDVSDYMFRRSLSPLKIADTRRIDAIAQLFQHGSWFRWSWEELRLYEIADIVTYDRRLSEFCEFYERFYDGRRSYSVEPDAQVDVFDLTTYGVVVVGYSSCHGNDPLRRCGAISPECIATAGDQLRRMPSELLRFAVWHHSTEGSPLQNDYMDSDVVQNLIDGGFSLGFHGHQHKPQFLDRRFRHGGDRRITIVSAGTLCGGATFGHRRAYNLIEIDTVSKKGCLHVREMQNDNLQMPIWGGRALQPGQESWSFDFDPPPRPFAGVDTNTVVLVQAERHHGQGNYTTAAEMLAPIAAQDPIARRLLLDCYSQLNDDSRIVAFFSCPESSVEAIAVMDALWRLGRRDQLAALIGSDFVAASSDPSVAEIRQKYTVRLNR